MPATPPELKGEPWALTAWPGVTVAPADPQVRLGAPGWPVVGFSRAPARPADRATVPATTTAADKARRNMDMADPPGAWLGLASSRHTATRAVGFTTGRTIPRSRRHQASQ